MVLTYHLTTQVLTTIFFSPGLDLQDPSQLTDSKTSSSQIHSPVMPNTPCLSREPSSAQQPQGAPFSKPLSRGHVENFSMLSLASLGGALSGSEEMSVLMLQPPGSGDVGQGCHPSEFRHRQGLSDSRISPTCGPDLPSSPGRAYRQQGLPWPVWSAVIHTYVLSHKQCSVTAMSFKCFIS